jgi:hypothetical protein
MLWTPQCPPGAPYEALDVQRRRGVVGAEVEGAAVGIFGADGERAAGNLFAQTEAFSGSQEN